MPTLIFSLIGVLDQNLHLLSYSWGYANSSLVD